LPVGGYRNGWCLGDLWPVLGARRLSWRHPLCQPGV